LKAALPATPQRQEWLNIGGQLFGKNVLNALLTDVKNNKIKSWDDIHDFYLEQGNHYAEQKLHHAYASLLEILNISPSEFSKEKFSALLDTALTVREWMTQSIYSSREKDYTSEFRKMNYDSEEEMNEVLGKLEDNSFINNQKRILDNFKSSLNQIRHSFNL